MELICQLVRHSSYEFYRNVEKSVLNIPNTQFTPCLCDPWEKIIRIKALKYLSQENIQDLRKRVTVLDCQLRKSESARKTFEVATEKLLQFVEVTLPFISSNILFGKGLC